MAVFRLQESGHRRFFSLGGLRLVAFQHVFIKYRESFSPAHKNIVEMSRQSRFFFLQTTSESRIIMKITRRTFVKKSSYTAAAVTVLGAGVGLANGISYGGTWAVVWQLSTTGGETVKVGPFDTEAQAKVALRNATRAATSQVNLIESSPLTDVSGMTAITRIRVNSEQGAEVEMEIKQHPVTLKWWGQCVIPEGTIHTTYYE